MDKVKRFAIGAGIVFGAGFIASKVMAYVAANPDGAVKATNPLVTYAGPLAGGALAVGAHVAGLL